MQKLAALLVMLGPEGAAQILKAFDESEIERISREMAKLPPIAPAVQLKVMQEFTGMMLDADTSVQGGLQCVQRVLEKAVGTFRATNIMSRVAPARVSLPDLRQIADSEPRDIFNLIRNEQPQVFALVLSFLGPEKASQTVTMLPEEQRHEVLERLATLTPAPIEAVETVVEVLTQKLTGKAPVALSRSGGVKVAADVLKALEKPMSSAVLTALEERNRELGQAIREKMFTFEDLARLESTHLQRVLREVDLRDLAVALKGTSETTRAKLFVCISKRAGENVREEMALGRSVRPKEIQAAQLRIIELARRLEEAGEIEIDCGNSTAKTGNAS
jgi:flagellar motor switch protein FliG